MLPYQVIYHKEYTAVKLNPLAYEIKIFQHKPDKNAAFFINTNYFWEDQPIGVLKENNPVKYIDKCVFSRPIFLVDFSKIATIKVISKLEDLLDYYLASQAGPTLIDDGEIVYPQSLRRENFALDVARATKHTAIGVTEFNKIILYFSNNTSLSQMTFNLRDLGCKYAMNLDGGSSSSLKINDKVYGNSKPKYGIQFIENKKK
jgi:exopolysaccharide biosynthesis protein